MRAKCNSDCPFRNARHLGDRCRGYFVCIVLGAEIIDRVTRQHDRNSHKQAGIIVESGQPYSSFNGQDYVLNKLLNFIFGLSCLEFIVEEVKQFLAHDEPGLVFRKVLVKSDFANEVSVEGVFGTPFVYPTNPAQHTWIEIQWMDINLRNYTRIFDVSFNVGDFDRQRRVTAKVIEDIHSGGA